MENTILLLFAVLLGLISGSFQSGINNSKNPCTPEALKAGHYHHPYPSNPSKYIQCTEWGNYHIMSCYPGKWDAETNTCKHNGQQGNNHSKGQTIAANTHYAGFDDNVQGSNGGNQAGIEQQNGQGQPWNRASNKWVTQLKPQDGKPGQWFGYNRHSPPKPQKRQMLPQDGEPSLWSGYNQMQQGNNQAQGANNQPKGGNHQIQMFSGSQTQNARADVVVQQRNIQQHQQQAVQQRPTERIVSGTIISNQPYQEISNTQIRNIWQVNNTQKSYQYHNQQGSNGQTGSHHIPAPPSHGQKGGYYTPALPTHGQKGTYNTPPPPVTQPPSSGKSHGMGQKSSLSKSNLPGSYKSHGNNGVKSSKSHSQAGKGSQEWVNTANAGKSSEGNINDPSDEFYNPCRDPTTHYLTHRSVQISRSPTNPFKYYECVNGQAQERDCPTDHVWIQRDEQCKSLKPSHSKNYFQNPCEGNQKFLPYPEDGTKYIECVGWSRQEVRSCPAVHVWSQNHQMCLAERAGQPQSHQPSGYQKGQIMITSAPSASNNIPSNFCVNSDSFHHPYPPNPIMYIQCDEFGSMYLRFCGPDKHWDDSVKTCIGEHSGADQKGDTAAVNYVDYSDSDNKDYDDQYNNVVPVSDNMFGKINTDKTPEPFLCPEGMEWMPSQVRCVSTDGSTSNTQGSMQCPVGTVWLDTVHGCLDLSRGTNIINQVIPINCPQSFVFDLETGQCKSLPAGGNVNPLSGQLPSCDRDYVWDAQMSMCIKKPGASMVVMNDVPNGGVGDAVFTLYGPSVRVSNGGNGFILNQGLGDGNAMMPPQNSNGFVYFPNSNNGMTADNGKVMPSSSDRMGHSGNGITSNGNVIAPLDNGMGYTGNGMSNGNGIASTNDMASGSNTGMLLTDMNGAPVHTNAHQGQTIPVSVTENPCGTSEGFYYAYSSDPRYFIQCDEYGAMFVHPCGYSLVWDQELLTCVPWSVMLSVPTEGQEIRNPCINSDKTFFDFPYNKYLYIMCMGSQPYMMPCSVGLVWDNDITTCVKPHKPIEQNTQG